jgi:hypothetical protein
MKCPVLWGGVGRFPVPGRGVAGRALSGREKTKFFPPGGGWVGGVPAGGGGAAGSFLQRSFKTATVYLPGGNSLYKL